MNRNFDNDNSADKTLDVWINRNRNVDIDNNSNQYNNNGDKIDNTINGQFESAGNELDEIFKRLQEQSSIIIDDSKIDLDSFFNKCEQTNEGELKFNDRETAVNFLKEIENVLSKEKHDSQQDQLNNRSNSSNYNDQNDIPDLNNQNDQFDKNESFDQSTSNNYNDGLSNQYNSNDSYKDQNNSSNDNNLNSFENNLNRQENDFNNHDSSKSNDDDDDGYVADSELNEFNDQYDEISQQIFNNFNH